MRVTPRTLNAEKEYRRLKKLLTHKTDNIYRTLKISFKHPEKYHGTLGHLPTTRPKYCAISQRFKDSYFMAILALMTVTLFNFYNLLSVFLHKSRISLAFLSVASSSTSHLPA